jgi:hypothetical protein
MLYKVSGERLTVNFKVGLVERADSRRDETPLAAFVATLDSDRG